jgi:hypothetical protein
MNVTPSTRWTMVCFTRMRTGNTLRFFVGECEPPHALSTTQPPAVANKRRNPRLSMSQAAIIPIGPSTREQIRVIRGC